MNRLPNKREELVRVFPFMLAAAGLASFLAWYWLVYSVECDGVMEGCGMTYRLASELWGFTVTVAVLFVMYGLGHIMLNRFHLKPFDNRAQYRLFYIVLAVLAGYWLFQSLLFLFLVLDLQKFLPFIFAALVIMVSWHLFPEKEPIQPPVQVSAETRLVLWLVVAGLLPFLLMLLLPDSNWDSTSVHLPLASWYARHGMEPVPLEYSAWIMASGVHMVYALFLLLGSSEAMGWLNFSAYAGVLVIAWSLARVLSGERAGAYSVLVLAGTGLLLQLALDARIDGFLGLFVFAAVALLFWPGQERAKRTSCLLLAAIALGNALGTKFSAIMPVALLGLVLLLQALRMYGPAIPARLVAAGLLFLLVPSVAWYGISAWQTGDPVYPFLHGEVLSFTEGERTPLYAGLDQMLDEGVLPAVDGPMSREFLEKQQQTAGKVPSLLNPFSVFLDSRSHGRVPFQNLGVLMAAFFLVPFFIRERRVLLLAATGLALYISMGVQTYILRYAIFALPVMAVPAAVVLARFHAPQARVLVIVAGMGSLAYLAYWETSLFLERNPAQWLSGNVSEVDWLSSTGYDGDNSIPLLVKEIQGRINKNNSLITATDKILFVGESKTFLLPVKAVPDISRYASHWSRLIFQFKGSYPMIYKQLEREGITHIAVNYGYLGWVSRNIPLEQDRFLYIYNHLHGFLEKYSEEWLTSGGIKVYRLRKNPSSSS